MFFLSFLAPSPDVTNKIMTERGRAFVDTTIIYLRRVFRVFTRVTGKRDT